MQYKVFNVPVGEASEEEKSLNQFLLVHGVVGVEKHLVALQNSAYWSFCVAYVPNITAGEGLHVQIQEKKEKVDFADLLGAEAYERFSALREIRKQLANEDAVLAYAVFTNDELAEISKLCTLSKEAMLAIPGIGVKKVEKYADKLVTAYNAIKF